MKILILNDTALPIGGAELMTLSLKNELIKLGHDARVFSTDAIGPLDKNFAEYNCFGTIGKFRTLNRAYNPFAYIKLRKVLQEFNPNVVHIRMFFTQLSPSILPLIKKIPTIYHATWLESICPKGIKLLPDYSICNHKAGINCLKTGCLSIPAWTVLMLQNKLFHHWKHGISLIVANSHAIKNQLLTNNIAPIEVVYNGIPITSARPSLADIQTISCATRLSSEKGLDVLIGAFCNVIKILPNTKLIIAGEGNERKNLEALIVKNHLEDKVILLGHIPRENLEEALASAWVHVVPSRCEEGFGLTAAEAMMRGTAVIASRIGGLPEVVQDEVTGYLVTPGDSKSLEEKLILILQNKDLAEKMGKAGRKRAMEFFSERNCAERFLSIYKNVIFDNTNSNNKKLYSV